MTSLELRNNLKRKNVENVDERENEEPERRYSPSNSVLKALQLEEIVECITKHLSDASDHNNFRCLFTSWKKYCEPKFVFRKSDSPSLDIMHLLYNSGYRYIKLEFQDYPLEHIPVNLWEKLGRKIRSLRLHCCEFENETLQPIISNCINLEDLEITRKNGFHSFPELSFVQLLDYFIERKEQRNYLRKLAISGQKFNMSELLQKSFTVFPRIVNLTIVQEPYDDDEGSSRPAVSGTYDLQKLTSFTMISKNDYLWSSDPVVPILDYPAFRLTKFKTVLYERNFLEGPTAKERLLQFFTCRKDLKVIDLEIQNELSGSFCYKSMIFHVLKNCSNLRVFYLNSHSTITITLTSEEINEFFSLVSNLQRLQLPCALRRDTGTPESTEPSLSLNPNMSLSVLHLNTEDSYFLSMMIQSPQLEHLNIDVYSDQQLRTIIMAVPNLKTLILRLHGCTNYGLSGENEESSIRRLQKLDYLEIIDSGGCITKEAFNQFSFPCLKYLKLTLRSRDNLPETLPNLPSVRALQIHFVSRRLFVSGRTFSWKLERLSELCKSLKNLERLFVDELVCGIVSDQPVESIFNLFSKLRCIAGCEITFLFNRRSRETICSLTRDLEFIENKFFPKSACVLSPTCMYITYMY